MNKAELVAAVAEKAEISKKDAEAAVKAFTDVVAEELKKGEKIQLVGFGTFEVSERAARVGRNPQTKQEITIPASKAPKFKAHQYSKISLTSIVFGFVVVRLVEFLGLSDLFHGNLILAFRPNDVAVEIVVVVLCHPLLMLGCCIGIEAS